MTVKWWKDQDDKSGGIEKELLLKSESEKLNEKEFEGQDLIRK